MFAFRPSPAVNQRTVTALPWLPGSQEKPRLTPQMNGVMCSQVCLLGVSPVVSSAPRRALERLVLVLGAFHGEVLVVEDTV